MRWNWDRVLELDVPEGWRVSQENGIIEIEPPSRLGTMKISVYRRQRRGPLAADEADQLAFNFARRIGAQDLTLTRSHQARESTAAFSTMTRDAESLRGDLPVRAQPASVSSMGLTTSPSRCRAERVLDPYLVPYGCCLMRLMCLLDVLGERG